MNKPLEFGQKFNNLIVIGKIPRHGKVETKWILECLLCGGGTTSTAGRLTNNRVTACKDCQDRFVGGKRPKIEDQYLTGELDNNETHQLNMIIKSRKAIRDLSLIKAEAIDLIIRDRQLNELKCHGGTELI